jgi:hypothetical protein
MTSRELREILQKVRLAEAVRQAGCIAPTLRRYSRRQKPVPQHIAKRLAPLRDFRPLTPREVRAIVHRAGGPAAALRALNIAPITLLRLMKGSQRRPTIAMTRKLRELWSSASPKRLRMTRRPLPGVAPMSVDEAKRLVSDLGGVQRAARLVGCLPGTLYNYCRGQYRAVPVIAVLLREATHRRSQGEADERIVKALQARAVTLLAARERPCDRDGKLLTRNHDEMAACVDQVVALVAASLAPVSPEELCRALGACKRTLGWPLRRARQTGRIVPVGRQRGADVRYRATGAETPIATGTPIWRASPPRPRRSPDVVRAEAERVALLLDERGPLAGPAIRIALGIPEGQVLGTLRHAERIGLVTRRVDCRRPIYVRVGTRHDLMRAAR